jgi:hypothetical protein
MRITRQSVKIAATRSSGRNALRCNQAEFIRLLLGHGEPRQAIAQKRLSAATKLARTTAETLLPALPLWHSPWDALYA